ncbi:MAG: hypothetical protein VCA74_01220 [Deltaproteobacteria bacterium]
MRHFTQSRVAGVFVPSMFTLSTLLLAVLAGLAVPADQAWAHEESHQLGGLKLVMTDPAGRPEKRKFLFKTKNQLGINDVSVDPSQTSSSLIVRGAAAGDGNSGVVYLEAAGWKRIGKAANPKGWKYKKNWRYSDSSGVNKVLIKKGSNGGKLLVKAKGQFWPYWIAGAQGTVELSLLLGGEQYCAEFAGDRAQVKKNESGKVIAKSLLAPDSCGSVCGNGKLELGETCDDGNTDDADTCTAGCETACTVDNADYAGTFEAIQALIFDSPVYQCSNDICHGATVASGGLDLRVGESHAALINVPAQINPNQMRILPGDQDLSLLYNKIAEKTVGDVDAPGTPMPANAETVSSDYLELLRIWIRGGAQASGVVEGTAELLDACLPEPSPKKMAQLPVPDPTEGVQFTMPGYPLLANSERELCVTTYYDLSDVVPAEARVPCDLSPGVNDTGECFSYGGAQLAQDPQSHHSIIMIYLGAYGWSDPGWGAWRCYLGDNDGQSCNPTDADPCPGGGVCGGEDVAAVACNSSITDGYGPPDWGFLGLDVNSSFARQFSGAQEATGWFNYVGSVDGIYSLLPLKGVVVWNSHAFNLTNEDMRMEGWTNLLYTGTRTYPSQQLFDTSSIFVQDVPPFEQREYCATHTFKRRTNLYYLTSHTHRLGVRWRYYLPPQTPCTGGGPAQAPPGCEPGDPADIFYESFDYNDPIEVGYDPPWIFDGPVEDRTIKYCSLYDNGYTDPWKVKRRSTSPSPPVDFGPFIPGGPCDWDQTYCLGGPSQGELCYDYDPNCPGGVCDACIATGGVTTGDEMFIPLGFYYRTPAE